MYTYIHMFMHTYSRQTHLNNLRISTKIVIFKTNLSDGKLHSRQTFTGGFNRASLNATPRTRRGVHLPLSTIVNRSKVDVNSHIATHHRGGEEKSGSRRGPFWSPGAWHDNITGQFTGTCVWACKLTASTLSPRN